MLLLSTYAAIGQRQQRKKVGCLITRWHNVNGTVFIKSKKELFVKNFNYDGQGLGVYFNIGKITITDCKMNLIQTKLFSVLVVCL